MCAHVEKARTTTTGTLENWKIGKLKIGGLLGALTNSRGRGFAGPGTVAEGGKCVGAALLVVQNELYIVFILA